jgi:hypothetical protein
MPRYSRFQMVSFCLVTAGVIGIAIYSWAIYQTPRWSWLNATRIASLFGSIFVIAVLLVLSGIAFTKATASKGAKSAVAFIGSFVVFMGAIVSLVMAMDWLFVGSIRSTTGPWSQLPHGNLFVGAGKDGWTYLGLSIVLVIGIFGKKLSNSLMVYLGFREQAKAGTRHQKKMDDDPPQEVPWEQLGLGNHT